MRLSGEGIPTDTAPSTPPSRSTAPPTSARTLALVDGEHYAPVVRAALADLTAGGRTVVGVVLAGGTEKLPASGLPDLGAFEVVTGSDPLDALERGLGRFHPDEVYDLADEPVVEPRTRLRLAAAALARGVAYSGPDFALTPPPRPRLATKPSIAVTGSGKRAGKTAVAAALARVLAADGRPPVVVAMGRGGPVEPELVDPAVADLSPAGLLARSGSGRHAASDHIEDAVASGVVTVGTRRCGGGLAGTPGTNTFEAGVALADSRPERLLVFEGSGRAIPPVHADAVVHVVPSGADPDTVVGHLGAVGVLPADLVVVTLMDVTSDPEQVPEDPLTDSPGPGPSRSVHLSAPRPRAFDALLECLRGCAPRAAVVQVTLVPFPLGPVGGRSVFFATTAPGPAAARQARTLGTRHGANVVGWSNHLADRVRLIRDLDRAPGAEVLVTELKAAGVDVATKVALDAGLEVVYCDNRPEATGPTGLDDHLLAVADRAEARFAGVGVDGPTGPAGPAGTAGHPENR